VQLSHSWSLAAPVFDDANLVSFAGLVPIMALAERAGLSQLISEMVRIDPGTTKVRSAGVNPAGKLTSIAGMACGADCIDDLDMIRAGGMKRLFGGSTRRRRWGSYCGSSPTDTRCSCPRCCVATCSTW
jgi:hypothetical protein